MRVAIVDENDVIVSYKERSSLTDHDRIRCAVVLLHSRKGNYLLARRSLNKTSDPGKWGPSAGGTIEEGETYDSNIHKELEEEIGVTNGNLDRGMNIYHPDDRVFVQWFFGILDEQTPLILQESEVMDARWFSKEELIAMHEKDASQFTNGIAKWIERELRK